MIPYEELDRALARWKARTQGGAVQGDHEVIVDSAAVVQDVPVHAHEHGSVPQRIAGPGEGTGELDLDGESEVVETIDE